MRITADAVVIGAGSTGCSIAHQLVLAGMKTMLLERDFVASGTTGFSPAIVRHNYADIEISKLVQASLRTFRNWNEEVGGDCGFVASGFLTAFPESDSQLQRGRAEAMAECGIDVEVLSTSDLVKLQPDFIEDGLSGGVLEPGGGYCDPIATVGSLACAITRHGGEVRQQCEVTGIRVTNNRVVGIDTRSASIDTPVVVNAAGAWAAQLAGMCGRSLPIRISRHCIAILALPEASRLPRLFAYQERRIDKLYLRALTGGLCLVGSFDPLHEGTAASDGHCTVADEEKVLEYKAKAERRFRRLADAKAQGGWASVFDDTPDGNPLVGPDPQIAGLYVAAGMNGHCFKLAPVIGKGLTDIITGGQSGLNLSVFALNRFQ